MQHECFTEGGNVMLRLLSPRIFREGPKEYALPMFAFEDIDDVFKNWDLYNGT